MAIATWRNMARDDGQSPSKLFFGRIQRQRLPMLDKQAVNGSKCIKAKDALCKASRKSRNSNTKEYTTLPTGSFAQMQCHISKKWERAVRIIRARDNGSSYVVEGVSTGKKYIRGRRLLKPHPKPHFLEEAKPENNSVQQDLLRKKEPQRIQPPESSKADDVQRLFRQPDATCVHRTDTPTPAL